MKLTQAQRRRLRDQNILLVPGDSCEIELIVVNSRFIAACSRVNSAEEAKDFHQLIRKNHPAANHHVPAYVIGHGNSTISYCSDDGEPSGSSGRPILSVLQGSGFGDIAVVVTRYFGGTKLGIGGLVRAYSDAAKAVLDEADCCRKLPVDSVEITIPYNFFDQVRQLLDRAEVTDLNEKFTESVTLRFSIPKEAAVQLRQSLTELTKGNAVFKIVESGRIAFFPVKTVSE